MALVAQLHRDSRVLADRVRPLLRNDSVTRERGWTILYSEKRIHVYFDHHAAQTEFGRPLVDSTSTLALAPGQGVTDVSQKVFANLRWDEVRLPAPSSREMRSTPAARSWRNASHAPSRTWAS